MAGNFHVFACEEDAGEFIRKIETDSVTHFVRQWCRNLAVTGMKNIFEVEG